MDVPPKMKRIRTEDDYETRWVEQPAPPGATAALDRPQDLTGLIEKSCDWLTMNAPHPDPTIQEGIDLLDFFVKAAIIEAVRWDAITPPASRPDATKDSCEGTCNPFHSACGATFCTYEEMEAHQKVCPRSDNTCTSSS